MDEKTSRHSKETRQEEKKKRKSRLSVRAWMRNGGFKYIFAVSINIITS